MKSIKLLVLTLAGAMALTGCNTFKKLQNVPVIGDKTPGQTATSSSKKVDTGKIDKILYGEWIAVSVDGEQVKGEERPYIVFDTVATNPYLAKFYASNGCNIINGTVALTSNGEMRKASDYLSTMKYCPEAVYEIGVSTLLDNIGSYKLVKSGDEYSLNLYSTDKKQTMVLRRSDLNWLNGAWRVSRLGDRVLDEDAGIQMVIDIPENRLHGNTGCNIMNGTVTCNPDVQHSISFSNIGVTRMMCPDLAREQEFLDALSKVTSANRAEGDDHADLRDASGTLLMELTRISIGQEETE